MKTLKVNVLPLTFLNIRSLNRKIDHFGYQGIQKITQGKSYTVNFSNPPKEKDIKKILEILSDPIDEIAISSNKNDRYQEDYDFLLEVKLKAGVTDNRARVTQEIIEYDIDQKVKVSTSDLYIIKGDLSKEMLSKIGTKVLSNPSLNNINIYLKENERDIFNQENLIIPEVNLPKRDFKYIDINIPADELKEFSDKSIWALSIDELDQIKNHYNNEEVKSRRLKLGLKEKPTDVEMEIIAQTWSEHCKHKIFSSNITYSEKNHNFKKIEPKKIDGLFKNYIKNATYEVIKKFDIDWCISLFHDNAGIVRYDKNVDYCIKVETHNSPSAIDPYGGALTGILGVNRDILGCGVGAKPIANTNVLCFSPMSITDENLKKVPKKILHPKAILEGVHKGIEDGGNKSGIPTVNGAFNFHPGYVGKPLVYCGTIGALPQKIKGHNTFEKHQAPKDYIVVVGGDVGHDGIHGATFSSVELNENSPATAVQIGDPFMQKKVTDFLIVARDQMLYSGITDNGAGGLSSSIGEMAVLSDGATINLDKVPTKYPNLSPYEIIISESQERMSFSVPKDKLDAFLNLAKSFSVKASIIGNFTDTGMFEIKSNDKIVGLLPLNFLHESLIPMELNAVWEGPKKEILPFELEKNLSDSLKEKIIQTISSDNIRSKENLIRQYDHEVKAQTVLKPFLVNKASGPSDAGIIYPKNEGCEKNRGIVISSGIYPSWSHIDTYYMAQMATDEAIRNIVASGGDPNKTAITDNFCWPDPIKSLNCPDGEHKLAQLVRACEGLKDIILEYGTPLVSGKDSMKNDMIGENFYKEKVKVSVPPTLLITGMSDIKNIENKLTTNFKNHGDIIYLLGKSSYDEIHASEYTRISNIDTLSLPKFHLKENKNLYERIYSSSSKNILNSCHDISEGGTITSIFESALTNYLGVQICVEKCLKDGEKLEAFLFNETPGTFIVSVSPEKKNEFEKFFEGIDKREVGKVTTSECIEISNNEVLSLKELEEAWKRKI